MAKTNKRDKATSSGLKRINKSNAKKASQPRRRDGVDAGYQGVFDVKKALDVLLDSLDSEGFQDFVSETDSGFLTKWGPSLLWRGGRRRKGGPTVRDFRRLLIKNWRRYRVVETKDWEGQNCGLGQCPKNKFEEGKWRAELMRRRRAIQKGLIQRDFLECQYCGRRHHCRGRFVFYVPSVVLRGAKEEDGPFRVVTESQE